MTYVQICLYNYILANLPPDVSADLPDIFYVFFCCGLVQREVLLWNFKDYLKFQRNITEKFQKDRQFFYP